jgi:hypothetical protein
VRRLEIGWREGNGTNTRLCSSIGFDGVVAERLLAGRGGRGPLDLRNGKGPPAWRKGRRRCRQGATCHRFAREILWVGGRRRGQLGVFLPWLPVSGDYSGLQAHRWWGLRDFFDFQALGLGARTNNHQHQGQCPQGQETAQTGFQSFSPGACSKQPRRTWID